MLSIGPVCRIDSEHVISRHYAIVGINFAWLGRALPIERLGPMALTKVQITISPVKFDEWK
jgi:hypothetical protein